MRFLLEASTPKTIWSSLFGPTPLHLPALQTPALTSPAVTVEILCRSNHKDLQHRCRRLTRGRLLTRSVTTPRIEMLTRSNGTSRYNVNWVGTRCFPLLTLAARTVDFL